MQWYILRASGGHTGADLTMLIDFDGTVNSIQTAKKVGIKRYVMISAVGVHHRENWLEKKILQCTKDYADLWMENSDLD